MKKTGFQYVNDPEIKLSGIKKITMLGDPGCTGFYHDSKKVLNEILKQKADLFFILGDLVFTGAEEEFQEIFDFCHSRVKTPIYALCGNHDLPHYSRFLGLRTYALILDHHICLFLCDAGGCFLEKDIEFLKKELEKYPEKDFILLMHIPPPMDGNRSTLKIDEWKKVKAVLDRHKKRIKHVFCAHVHGFSEYQADGYPVTITAGGGAAMIYEFSKSAQKLFHSIEVDLKRDGSLNIKVIPVAGMYRRVKVTPQYCKLRCLVDAGLIEHERRLR